MVREEHGRYQHQLSAMIGYSASLAGNVELVARGRHLTGISNSMTNKAAESVGSWTLLVVDAGSRAAPAVAPSSAEAVAIAIASPACVLDKIGEAAAAAEESSAASAVFWEHSAAQLRRCFGDTGCAMVAGATPQRRKALPFCQQRRLPSQLRRRCFGVSLRAWHGNNGAASAACAEEYSARRSPMMKCCTGIVAGFAPKRMHAQTGRSGLADKLRNMKSRICKRCSCQ